MKRIIRYFLSNRLVAAILLIIVIAGGLAVAPFDYYSGPLPHSPISVDAVPDVGENQQIVVTEWMGRSPKDIQDQITYPLTTSLLGIKGVKTIRSTSMFGMSFIYIIFEEDVDFYFSRSRILEKLASLPPNLLPEEVKPSLGPDATGLGQIFWYTLEGRDTKTGKPSGGWNPDELRSVQDYYVKYALSSADGVAEVSSVGGFVKEYQVDINPDKLRSYNVNIMQVMQAVQKSNTDVGAGTVEINKAEYLIRGIGYVKNIKDLEDAVVTARNGVPVCVKDVADVHFGPAPRRGGLDKEGVEAVGGVVVSRYGANPMEVINNVKQKIEEISLSLPEKTLKDGSISKINIVPFYDRTQLIKETAGTLENALSEEVLICIIVVLILVLNLRSSLVIALMLPLSVFLTFIVMKLTGTQANIVALSGIAIAIGIMVVIGVVFMENTVRRLERRKDNPKGKDLENLISDAVCEVAPAITTAMITTVISFLPVFAMQAQEGKMFHPLALTKTFALISAFLLGILLLPTLAYWIFSLRLTGKAAAKLLYLKEKINSKFKIPKHTLIGLISIVAVWFLAKEWLPLGADKGVSVNLIFVALIIAAILTLLWLLVIYYERILRWCLRNKGKFLLIPCLTVVCAFFILRNLGSEFMPSLDEGAYMLMPTSMPTTGVEENIKNTALLDKRLKSIPEIETAIGKWGRAESALDCAPVQMYEITINYLPEYMLGDNGKRAKFKTKGKHKFLLTNGKIYDAEKEFRIIPKDSLIESKNGEYFRQWRKHIKNKEDIWQAILDVSKIPGVTTSPKLQPISTRIVMLSTGMRSPMGLKITGADIDSIEKAGIVLERELKKIKSINAPSVFYDRLTGAPYIEIEFLRSEMARYGITIDDAQEIVSVALGGMELTKSVEGRERYSIRARYARELRDNPEEMSNILIPTAEGSQIPLSYIAKIDYKRGAQMISSENTFLIGYVLFDKQGNIAETDVVNEAKKIIDSKVKSGEIKLPKNVNYKFAGNYEQQDRANKRLMLVIPVALLLILLTLYFQFKTWTASFIHFSGVFVAFAGGFILIWLYGQEWFLNFSVFGANLRDVFQIHTINMSVAVWVGFIALFGIATDDGVLMGTYIHQTFETDKPVTRKEITEAVVKAGRKRVRPAAMTTATTLIALLPVLTSTGKGADIMIPMAIPTFGGMLLQTMTMFVVPVLQYIWRCNKEKKNAEKELKNNFFE
ncbi:MAG: efflux RND transporter permease subunit [Bacteroidales bacterium]|nr:efflux RND transporter permease subunit [Bacteroidales bacterium]